MNKGEFIYKSTVTAKIPIITISLLVFLRIARVDTSAGFLYFMISYGWFLLLPGIFSFYLYQVYLYHFNEFIVIRTDNFIKEIINTHIAVTIKFVLQITLYCYLLTIVPSHDYIIYFIIHTAIVLSFYLLFTLFYLTLLSVASFKIAIISYMILNVWFSYAFLRKNFLLYHHEIINAKFIITAILFALVVSFILILIQKRYLNGNVD